MVGLPSVTKEEAIRAAGTLLMERGLVEQEYVDAMQRREESMSTYMGNGVSMPHGTFDAKGAIRGTGIVVMQYPEGVDWGDEPARLVIGLAADGDDHVAILSQLAEVLQEEDLCKMLWATDDPQVILDTLIPAE